MYVDARVFGTDLSAGIQGALAEEAWEAMRSGALRGPRRTQAEREGEAPVTSLAEFAATSVAVKGSLGVLSVEGSVALPAATGESTAQRNLASFFEHGVGVPRDVAAALTWYRRAADGGHAGALADWERLSAT